MRDHERLLSRARDVTAASAGMSRRMRHWDPYPFILLNLMLSFQAAYSAPIISS